MHSLPHRRLGAPPSLPVSLLRTLDRSCELVKCVKATHVCCAGVGPGRCLAWTWAVDLWHKSDLAVSPIGSPGIAHAGAVSGQRVCACGRRVCACGRSWARADAFGPCQERGHPREGLGGGGATDCHETERCHPCSTHNARTHHSWSIPLLTTRTHTSRSGDASRSHRLLDRRSSRNGKRPERGGL